MSEQTSTKRFFYVNFGVLVIVIALAVVKVGDPFWIKSSVNPVLAIVALTGCLFGFLNSIPVLLIIPLAFMYWVRVFERTAGSNIFATYSSWFYDYGLTFLVCLFSEFNTSIVRQLKDKLNVEKNWAHIQRAATQKLEANIRSLKWRLTVETQPMSYVIKYARGLLGASPAFVARFTIDLIVKRFRIDSVAVYELKGDSFVKLDARGSCEASWPVELTAANIHDYPYAHHASNSRQVASPREQPGDQLLPQICCPILDDTNHLRGLLVCDRIPFMEYTNDLVEYLTEISNVCGSALATSAPQSEPVERRLRARKFKFVSEAEFRLITMELTKIYPDSLSLTERRITLKGAENLHGRQSIIIHKFIVTQLERRDDVEGFFTIHGETIQIMTSHRSAPIDSIKESIVSTLTLLQVYDVIQLMEG